MPERDIIGFPFALPFFVFLVVLLFLIPWFVSEAFRSLGFSFEMGVLLFFVSLFGSFVNIPLYIVRTKEPVVVKKPSPVFGLIYPESEERYRVKRTSIAINFGGAIVPLFICLFLVISHPELIPQYLVGASIITAISYKLARPLPGVGITLPTFVPPILAALVSLLIPGSPKTAIAFFSGVSGVILGADVLNLSKTAKSGADQLSIGGAGTFDGIFLTGLISVLLVA